MGSAKTEICNEHPGLVGLMILEETRGRALSRSTPNSRETRPYDQRGRGDLMISCCRAVLSWFAIDSLLRSLPDVVGDSSKIRSASTHAVGKHSTLTNGGIPHNPKCQPTRTTRRALRLGTDPASGDCRVVICCLHRPPPSGGPHGVSPNDDGRIRQT